MIDKQICKDCAFVWTYQTGVYCIKRESIIDPDNIFTCNDCIPLNGRSICDICKHKCPKGGSRTVQCTGFSYKESEDGK